MNEEEAVKIFEKYLATLSDTWADIDSMRWFCDDYDRYCQAFVNSICERIRFCRDRQVIQYYGLIDRISRTCENRFLYIESFSEVLPDLLRGSILRNDSKLLKILNGWEAENLYPPQVMQSIRLAMYGDDQMMQMAPQPEFSMPPRGIQLDMSVITPVMPERRQEEEPEEERRLARDWMRPALAWEDPKGAKELVVNVDADDTPEPTGEQSWIIINATNTGMRCKSCAGVLTTGKAPNGAPAYIDVVCTPDGYKHAGCHKLDAARKPKRSIFD